MQNIPRLLACGMATALFSLCVTTSAYAVSVHPEQTDEVTGEETGGTWDAAGESSADAWGKTKEASGHAWDATKETSADVWDKTKQISSDSWDATREFSSDAWDATREFSIDAWETTSDWVNGTDEDVTEETIADEPAPAGSGEASGGS